MTFILKISKPGFDVLEDTDSKNLPIDSTKNHLKTKAEGSFEETLSSFGSTTHSVAHGLSGRAMALAYFRDTTSSYYYKAASDPEGVTSRVSAPANVSIYTDTTNVSFYIENYSGDKTIEVQYEIFYEGE